MQNTDIDIDDIANDNNYENEKRGMGRKTTDKKRFTEAAFSVREFNLPVVKNRITFAPV